MDPITFLVAYLLGWTRARKRLLDTVTKTWNSLGDWHGDATAERFAQHMKPTVEGAQLAAATLAIQRITGQIQLEDPGWKPPALSAKDFVGSNARAADPLEVYQRPFHQLWYDLSQGKPFDDAFDKATHRLNNLAATDLELAANKASQALLDSKEASGAHVVGYRRVLTGAENCGLCIVASTQRYHKEDLMPMHPGCDCVVAPIIGTKDPGQTINSHLLTEGELPTRLNAHGGSVYSSDHTIDVGDMLESVHDAIKDTFGISDRGGREIDYRKVITQFEHGELGPMLKPSTELHH